MNPSAIPTLARFTLDNADPAWFWIALFILAVMLLVAAYRSIYSHNRRHLTWVLLALRMVGVLALLVALVKPAWTLTSTREEKPRLAIILDNSQSMSTAHPTADGAWMPRYRIARDWLLRSAQGKQISAGFDTSFFDIAGQPLDPGAIPDEPAMEQTDLFRSLRAAASPLRGQGGAILLISDGRDTTGRDSFVGVRELGPSVFAVVFKPTVAQGGRYDLAVASVVAPKRAMVHNTVPIRVVITKDGGPALDLAVQIERAGTMLTTQSVALSAGATQTVASISWTPDQAGDLVLSVRIPEQPNERTAANNSRPFNIRVDADPIRVLLVEGFLRPEFTFLRNHLADDPDVDLITFVRSANPEQNRMSSSAVSSELISAERLKKINVVLLGDFESSMLQPDAYAALRQWVEEGGAVFVLGGYNNLGAQGLGQTPLVDLLPLMPEPTFTQFESPVSISLTEEGKRHPALVINGEVERDAAAWALLPELKGLVLTGAPRPAATVLIRTTQTPPGAKEGYPVLAMQPYGKGTVALLTADTTWRWSRIPRLAGKPDTLYSRFWSQMIRYLAKRDIASNRPALVLSTDAAGYERGQRVTLRARRNPAALVPGQENLPNSLVLTVTSPDRRTTQLTPTQSSDINQWTASFFPDRGGRFDVDARLVAATDKGSLDIATQKAQFIVQGSVLELDDPSPNPASLAQLANASGGLYADLDDARAMESLVQSLPNKPQSITVTARTALWNNPVLFLLFLGCICAEWIIRRWNNLV